MGTSIGDGCEWKPFFSQIPGYELYELKRAT